MCFCVLHTLSSSLFTTHSRALSSWLCLTLSLAHPLTHSLILSRALSFFFSQIWSEVPEVVEVLLDLAMRCSDGSRERIAKKRPTVEQCIAEITKMLQSDDLSQV